MKKVNVTNVLIAASCYLLVFVVSCRKLVEIGPQVTSINADNVYESDETASSVLNGLYAKMSSANFSIVSITSISLYCGLSADELSIYDNNKAPYNAYYRNALASNLAGYELWNNIYPYIFTCNSAIEGLENSKLLTLSVKQQLIGEAKFMRAFFYFYLVNLYGDVPLVTATDYSANVNLARLPVNVIYQQIVTDLIQAKESLSSSYVGANSISGISERVRPNKSAAAALLARVYLYTDNWADAEIQASSLIDNKSTYGLTTLDSVFLKNSNETIWQLQPVNANFNTEAGRMFILPATGPSSNFPVYLTSNLYSSFLSGDQRRAKWLGNRIIGSTTYYYPYKYKIQSGASVTEYLMVLRLAEQYLIRAEARLRRGNRSGTLLDLNMLLERAGLSKGSDTSQSALMKEIMYERQVELFAEWGHRWLDLKRIKSIDSVMNFVTLQKGGNWMSSSQLYPLPISDLQKDLNLQQNPGY